MPDTTAIRTRFAPSPTGYLHVGGLRAALYNYLFAKHNGGTFVLRIEDTDQARLVEGALENIIATMKWSGIDYDEGPHKEGDCGPYIQSQRNDLYKKHAQELIEKGSAYYCFCTAERLEEVRKKQTEQKLPPMYDRHCRNLSPEEVKEKLNAGTPHVVRQKIPLMGDVKIHDLVRGEVLFNTRTLDDHVLVKSDGFPTYHLANIVDDHYMRISHVIRGEEWLPSAPRHVLLYEAFGWQPPVFAHLPLLLNPDRTKLSKRQGDVAVEDYRDKGFLPDALVNFIALLGWNPGTEQEIFSLQELTDLFSFEHVHKAGAIFDTEKLKWMNAQYIKKLSLDDVTNACIPVLQSAGYPVDDRERVKRVIHAVRTHLHSFADITEYAKPFFVNDVVPENDEAAAMVKDEKHKKVFSALLDAMQSMDAVSEENFMPAMKQAGAAAGVKGKELYMPVRIALTGQQHGPELPLVASALGKEEVVRRITKYL
jgi:glutamyl-tRNA synthetase